MNSKYGLFIAERLLFFTIKILDRLIPAIDNISLDTHLAKGATQVQKILMRMRQTMRDMQTASYRCMKMCLHEEGAVGAGVTVDAIF